jgi:transposase
MPRYTAVVPHLSVDELHTRYRHAHDPVARSHWQVIWLMAQGHHVPEVAQMVGYTANWVREIVRRYNTAGPEGVVDQRSAHRGGNPPLLSPALRTELAAALDGPAPDGGVWTCHAVAAWMAARLGRPVADARGWEALRALGFSLQRPRPRATTADPEAQEAFKKGGSKPRWMRSPPPIPTPR